MPDSVVRRITWRSSDVVRVLLLVVVFLFLWKFFWMVYTALFLGLLAVLIAMILHAPAAYLARWMPFRLSFTLTVLAFFAAMAALLIELIPQILDQIPVLATQLPAAVEEATQWINEKTGSVGDSEMARELNQQLADFVGRFVPLAFNLISLVVGSFAILTLAIFMAIEPKIYRDLFLRLVPPGSRAGAERIYDEAGRSLRNWMIGKAFTMGLIGVFAWIGLTLFEVPGALALASLAALLEFVPTFGPTIAAAPAVVSAFLVSPTTALYVAIYYFVLQQIQNAVTMPLVERQAVDIPPAALLLWQLMLAVGFGILGLFVATPLLAVLVVAVRVMYIEPTEARYGWDRRDSFDPEDDVEPPLVSPAERLERALEE
jgi:predicted PurR-regulated permease PerM